MTRIIVTIFVICIINVIYFESMISLGSDDSDIADTALFKKILAEIQQGITTVKRMRPQSFWELFESSIDNKEAMDVIKQFNEMKPIILNDYRTLDWDHLDARVMYASLYNDKFKNTMDMLENIQSIFLAWMSKNFQQDIAKLTSNKKENNDMCNEYHRQKKSYYYILEDLMIIDMMAIAPSIFINQFYILEQDKLNPSRDHIPITETVDLFTYGRTNHLKRVKVYAEAALNIGKNITGPPSLCEQSLLTNEHRKFFEKFRTIYENDRLGFGSEKSVLKNMFQRFNQKVDEERKKDKAEQSAAKWRAEHDPAYLRLRATGLGK